MNWTMDGYRSITSCDWKVHALAVYPQVKLNRMLAWRTDDNDVGLFNWSLPSVVRRVMLYTVDVINTAS